MKALYNFSFDCGRMGCLEGVFIATREELEAAIGKELYFGEALGKHSEISGPLEANDIKMVSEDQEKIEWLELIFNGTTISGFNPLAYLSDGEYGDERSGV